MQGLWFWAAWLCWDGEKAAAVELPPQITGIRDSVHNHLHLPTRGVRHVQASAYAPYLHNIFFHGQYKSSAMYTWPFVIKLYIHISEVSLWKRSFILFLAPIAVKRYTARLNRWYCHKLHCDFQVTPPGLWSACWIALQPVCSRLRSFPGLHTWRGRRRSQQRSHPFGQHCPVSGSPGTAQPTVLLRCRSNFLQRTGNCRGQENCVFRRQSHTL